MPALTANPLVNPAAYDQVTIAGQTWPAVPYHGLVRVSGATRVYGWDIKDGPGAQGSTTTYRGYKPSDSISFRFEFFEASHVDDFATNFLPLFQYDASKTAPKPVTVFHPALQAQGITALVTKQIGQFIVEDDRRVSLTIELIEYRPAPKVNATSTPKSATGTTPKTAAGKPSVEDDQDREIAMLREKARLAKPKS